MTDKPRAPNNWQAGSCVKCGMEMLFWGDPTGRRCNKCDREGRTVTRAEYDKLSRALAVAKEALEFYAKANCHPQILVVAPQFRLMAIEALAKLNEGEK